MSRKSGGLGRAGLLMASGSIFSRLLGIMRNALLAMCVAGSSPASTAYNTANTLPNLIFQLLSGGLITSILIPQLTKAMRRDEDSREAVDALLTLTLMAVFVVTVISTVTAAPLITFFRLHGPTRDLAVLFAYICLPQIFFYGAYAVLGQVLNVRDRFGEYMWTPVLANVVQIAGMMIFLVMYGQVPHAEGWTNTMIWLLAGSTTLGIAIQAFGLIPGLRATGFSWRPNFRARGYGFAAAAKIAAWTIVAIIIAQIGGIVTQQAINEVWSGQDRIGLGKDSPNIFLYLQAFTIFMVPFGVVTVSILTALFPQMAAAFQDDDEENLLSLTVQGFRLPAVILVPMTFAAIALAVPGVGALNPGFEDWEIRATALAFAIMAAGLVPFSISALQQRFSMSREDGRTNLRFQLIITGVQIVTAAVVAFTAPPQLSVALVALGQTVGHSISALAFIIVVRRSLGGGWVQPLFAMITEMALLSAIPAALSGTVVFMLYQAMDDSWRSYLIQLGVGTALFILLFLPLAALADIPELSAFLARFSRRPTKPASDKNTKKRSVQARQSKPKDRPHPRQIRDTESQGDRTRRSPAGRSFPASDEPESYPARSSARAKAPRASTAAVAPPADRGRDFTQRTRSADATGQQASRHRPKRASELE